MHLYLDTADRNAAEPLLATGLFTGLTTNPTILRRASRGIGDIPEIYRWATASGAHEVFFQAWGEDTPTLVERGRSLRELGEEVVVKLVASLRRGATGPRTSWPCTSCSRRPAAGPRCCWPASRTCRPW